jgi:hypothetical protein
MAYLNGPSGPQPPTRTDAVKAALLTEVEAWRALLDSPKVLNSLYIIISFDVQEGDVDDIIVRPEGRRKMQSALARRKRKC